MTGRNEKLAVRGQLFENLRANSRAIWRKLSGIWAGQTILQPVHGKPDSLLAKGFGKPFSTPIKIKATLQIRPSL
ncbi:MAG: hypothetical protein BA869_05480 [Desulfuromonadales bacterium C00003107]|nr:MAG: hypothetical protein BA869_05480 [Desulfuromonadales bacterium C00003107]